MSASGVSSFWRRLAPRTRWHTARSRPEGLALAALILLTLALGVLSFLGTGWFPLSAYALPMLLGMNVLMLRHLLALSAVTLVGMIVSATMVDFILARYAAVVVVLLTMAIVIWQAHRRALSATTGRGESMLIDLRDRIAAQGRLPPLPAPWHADAVLRSAGGASFAGDFLVAVRPQPDRLEVALVDVSGKGFDAGSRALMLSGAMSGLIGSLPPGRFLAAANDYLLRQHWDEEFATVAHVTLDLRTGDFETRTAGHPPPVQFNAGAGRWSVLWTEGPVLGVIDDVEFAPHRGRLQRGDALIVYTDGLVETRGDDIRYGIDRLVGEAERQMTSRFAGGASAIIGRIAAENDDRAMLILHRR